MLADRVAIQLMVVVGVNGIWYVLSRMPGTDLSDPRTLFDDFVNELDRLTKDQELPQSVRTSRSCTSPYAIT